MFVGHVLDEAVVDNEGPAGYFTCNSVGVDEAVNLGREYEANNTVEENKADSFNFVDVAVDGELPNLSSDSDLGDIPLEDGSDVDEEL